MKKSPLTPSNPDFRPYNDPRGVVRNDFPPTTGAGMPRQDTRMPIGTDAPRVPQITEVMDRPLESHAKLVALSIASRDKGAVGNAIGQNYQSFRESMRDLSQGVDTSEPNYDPNCFDRTNSQDIALLRRETESRQSNGYGPGDRDGFDTSDAKHVGAVAFKAKRSGRVTAKQQFNPGSLK